MIHTQIALVEDGWMDGWMMVDDPTIHPSVRGGGYLSEEPVFSRYQIFWDRRISVNFFSSTGRSFRRINYGILILTN